MIGHNQTTSKAKGVHLHATLAVGEDGVPLGILRCAYTTDQEAPAPKTQLWVDGVRDIAEAASHLSGRTRVLCVMDREADMFAILAQQGRACGHIGASQGESAIG